MGSYKTPLPSDNWEQSVKTWLRDKRVLRKDLEEEYITFFKIAVERTNAPEKTWIGYHRSAMSLIIGGLYIAALTFGDEKGWWLLLDQNRQDINGWSSWVTKSTKNSLTPLYWFRTEDFDLILNIIHVNDIWDSYHRATIKVFNSPVISADRDDWQKQQGRVRVSDLLSNPLPEEITESKRLYEGAVRRISVNAYERNYKARQECIAHYGCCCQVCGMDFGERYGERGKGFIHIHHLRPLKDIGAEYEVDPVRDLRPVCPNCHAMLHRNDPPYTIEQVRAFLAAAKATDAIPPHTRHSLGT